MRIAAGLFVCLSLALLAPSIVLGGNDATAEQAEVTKFIESMYSYDPDTFSLGRFSDRNGSPFLMNHVSRSIGKFNPASHCALLRSFFEEDTIKKRQTRSGTVECDADYRYPNLDAENLSSATRYIEIPKPRIEPPAITGNRARVSVLTGEKWRKGSPPDIELGRSLYFLTKTDAGWRVSNVMVHTKWPDLDDGTHNCYYSFARKPSDEERKEVPPHCRN